MKYLFILFFFLGNLNVYSQIVTNDSIKIKKLEAHIYNLETINKILFAQTDYLSKELDNKDKEYKERLYLFAEELKKKLLKSLNKK